MPLLSPAVVTSKRKRVLLPADTKKLEPTSAVVRKVKPCNDNRPEPEPVKKPAIVAARKPRGDRGFSDVPDLTPEEHQRRGDAAVALFREAVRRDGDK